MIRITLLLALALAATASHANQSEYFTAGATGKLTIGADGSVVDVDLRSSGSEGRLGKAVIEGYEERIRAWRFEPMTEGGTPVNVTGHMKLSLAAKRVPGEREAAFGIRKVWFLDPPSTAAGASAASPRHRMPLPVYPRTAWAERVGAEVLLALRIDAGGAVSEVGTRALALLGNVPEGESSRQRLARERHAGTFRQSAENIAKSWRFQGIEEGRVILVPLRYLPGGTSAWVRTVDMAVDVPLWIIASEADNTALRLDGSGEPLSTRIKLETELDDPGLATGAGS